MFRQCRLPPSSDPNTLYHPALPSTAPQTLYQPNNQALPHNALQHLAPTFTTPRYPISHHISPHHQTPSSISRNTLHRTTGRTNIMYRRALSSTCAHDAAQCHTTTLCSTSQHRTTPHQPALLSTTKYPAPLLIMAHRSMFLVYYKVTPLFLYNKNKNIDNKKK